MRARHRHFTYGAVENARLALDSRYIHQSDNTEVSPWSDRSRSGNDVSQATAANRPTFQTAEQGGNGVVRFDGSNDVLTRNEIAISSPVGGTLFLFVKRATGSTGEFLTAVEVPEYFRFVLSTTALNITTVGVNFIGYPDNGTGTVTPSQGFAMSTDSYFLTALNYNGSTASAVSSYTLSINGQQQTITQNGGFSGLARGSTVGIGARGTAAGHCGCDMGVVAVFGANLAAPIRKRVENAIAFSFKHSIN